MSIRKTVGVYESPVKPRIMPHGGLAAVVVALAAVAAVTAVFFL